MAIQHLSSIQSIQKRTVLSTQAKMVVSALSHPIPGVSKEEAMQHGTDESLMRMKESDPLLYHKIMNWD